MKSIELALDAMVNQVNEAYKMPPEYSNQKTELPLTRRERRAIKRKEKKHGSK